MSRPGWDCLCFVATGIALHALASAIPGFPVGVADPTRRQKSSGAGSARLAGVARGHPVGAMVRGSEVLPCHFSRSDFRTIAEGTCRVSATPAPILSPGAQRGFQRGAPFDTFFLPFDVHQKAVVVRGRNPAGQWPGPSRVSCAIVHKTLCPKLQGHKQTPPGMRPGAMPR